MTIEEWLGKDNKIGLRVWKEKYQYNNETFDAWIERISLGDSKLKQLMFDKKFLFGGRILANIGTGNQNGLSNCLTHGYVEDNLSDIMDTAKNLALSFKAEAGCGVFLSKIRPKGARIGKSGIADGVMGFARIFNEVTNSIKRGNARRGAILIGLHADHPDIFDFINEKKNNKGSTGALTSANISVLITDEFMEHYQRGESYKKDFVVESTGEVIPHIVDTVAIMNAIADTPKTCYEPGVIFVDRYRDYHLFGNVYGEMELAPNACSEFYGVKGTVCLLGSLNLSAFVYDGRFNEEEFRLAVRTAIVGLNKAHEYGFGLNALDIQNHRAKDYRGIGLGITGLADMFIKMGVKYGSIDSMKLCEEIGAIMRKESVDESKRLATLYGQPSGIVLDEEYLTGNNMEVRESGLYNNSLLSIAPAGSLSLLLDCSSGVEPVFRASYTRKTESIGNNGDEYHEVHHKAIQDVIETLGYKPDYCIDTTQVSATKKIHLIASLQKNFDLAISNTTNLPEETKIEDIRSAYVTAWRHKLIGLTMYVDNSIDGVLTEQNPSEATSNFDDVVYHNRPLKSGCGTLNLMIGYSESMKRIKDIFVIRKGAGGCEKNIQSTAIAISLFFKKGGTVEELIHSFAGIGGCSSYAVARTKDSTVSKGNSCGNSIVFALESFLKEMSGGELQKTNKNTCPECGEDSLANESGCVTCLACGYSKCG